MASAKYTPLDTHYLLSQSPTTEVTIQSFIDSSEQLAQEAREIMPYSFDECTYNKGYLRQAVWSCLDCDEKGVCYGCSISCHADHRLVELWTKRSFRCDCPSTSMPSTSKGIRRRCTLTPRDRQHQDPNEQNRYNQNFAGKFCRCGRDYDPETETEAMLNCMGCEDWYHETCLNLRERRPEGDDDDDDEEEVLIPSETYDGLICARCMDGCSVLKGQRGRDGWMAIEPGVEGSWRVVGRLQNIAGVGEGNITEDGARLDEPDPAKGTEGEAAEAEATAKETTQTRRGSAGDSVAGGLKHLLEQDDDIAPLKKPRLGADPVQLAGEGTRAGAGDIFLALGIRDELKTQLSAEEIATLPFPLEDDDTYEPPEDTDPDETLDQVTERVITNLPRVQAIEALHGYQTMKERLQALLASRAEVGGVVKKEDIDELFASLRQDRAG